MIYGPFGDDIPLLRQKQLSILWVTVQKKIKVFNLLLKGMIEPERNYMMREKLEK